MFDAFSKTAAKDLNLEVSVDKKFLQKKYLKNQNFLDNLTT